MRTVDYAPSLDQQLILKVFNSEYRSIRRKKDLLWDNFREYATTTVLPSGIRVKSIVTRTHIKEIWSKHGFDEAINLHSEVFYNLYPPQKYNSYIVKVGKDKYLFVYLNPNNLPSCFI